MKANAMPGPTPTSMVPDANPKESFPLGKNDKFLGAEFEASAPGISDKDISTFAGGSGITDDYRCSRK